MIDRTPLQSPRELGAVISDAFNIFSANWQVYLTIVLPAIVVSAVLSVIQWAVADSFLLALLFAGVSFGLSFVAYAFVTTGVVSALMDSERGTPNASMAFDSAKERLNDVISASIKAGVILAVLFITVVGIPIAIYLAVRWAFLVQSIVLDGANGSTALEASARLVQGRWWRTFLYFFVSALVVLLPLSIVGFIVGAILPGILGAIAGGIINAMGTAYLIIAATLIYFDLKARPTAET